MSKKSKRRSRTTEQVRTLKTLAKKNTGDQHRADPEAD
jgi:hypothetical protein